MIHTCRGVAKRGDQLLERAGAGGAARLERGDRLLGDVVDDALVAVVHQPPDHVGAHPARVRSSRSAWPKPATSGLRSRSVSDEPEVDPIEVERRHRCPRRRRSSGWSQHLRLAADASIRRHRSLLPDWTIGHVLIHIARNADSMLRMLAGPAAVLEGLREPSGRHRARRRPRLGRAGRRRRGHERRRRCAACARSPTGPARSSRATVAERPKATAPRRCAAARSRSTTPTSGSATGSTTSRPTSCGVESRLTGDALEGAPADGPHAAARRRAAAARTRAPGLAVRAARRRRGRAGRACSRPLSRRSAVASSSSAGSHQRSSVCDRQPHRARARRRRRGRSSAGCAAR